MLSRFKSRFFNSTSLNQLKICFIFLAIVSMTVTLVISFTAVNITLRIQLSRRADSIIEYLYENGGSFPLGDRRFDDGGDPPNISDETPFETRYYVVDIGEDSVIISSDYSHISINNIELVQQHIDKIIKSNKTKGYIDDYRFEKFDSEDGTMLIVVDCSKDLDTLNTLLLITLVTIISCIVIVFVLLVIFSKYVIRPFEKNIEKQKHFITDAGHELKTPIAIIRSNAEVMEMISGENKWLTNITNQTVRMSALVKGLIELSKMDEQTRSEKEKQQILFTEIVNDTVESFRVPAQTKGIEIQTQIMPKVYIFGDLEDIIRLVNILVDNAVKYTDSRGEIFVGLNYKPKSKNKKVSLVVSNTCAGLDRESIPKFFDRFYRSDSSRNSETGGYGIGLAMAQAIVQNYKGKLTAAYTPDERVVLTAEI